MKPIRNSWPSAYRATLSAVNSWMTKPPVALLSEHLRSPLYWNGYALLFTAIATSGLGIVYWALAARFYAANVVGTNSAVLSAMTLVSGIATLGLNNGLIRFVPLAGLTTKRLVVYIYLIGFGFVALASLAFGLSVSYWSPAISFIVATPAQFLSFIIVMLAWSLFTLQDSVLTGLRQTTWVAMENIIFAGLKIALLIFLAQDFPQLGILASWIIPIVVLLPPINILIFWRLVPRHTETIPPHLGMARPRPIIKYIVGSYLGSVFSLASTTLMPLIVISRAGATMNAYFYLPWLMAGGLTMVAWNMATSLTVEAARDLSRLNEFGYRIFIQILRILVPLVIVVLLGAPFIMRVFGSEYAVEGTGLLRWLALQTIPNAVVALSISVARVENRVSIMVLVQGVICILGLGLSYLLLPSWGLTGVGFAWAASQTLLAIFIGLLYLRPILRNGRVGSRQSEANKVTV